MFKIRSVKTSSGSTAIQVIRYSQRKRIIEAHIGSAKSNDDILTLRNAARDWINNANAHSDQLDLFPDLIKINSKNNSKNDNQTALILNKCRSIGFRYQILYDCLFSLITMFKFHLIDNSKILNDLVIARIAEPSSKLESLKFIERFFNIKYHRSFLYRHLSNFCQYKEDIESKIIAIAKKYFNFNFNLVFYDLTTLYFESVKDEDGGIRKIGFRKYNKSSNPEIMIGLLVNDLGFPMSYQSFHGNKFEGHTLMPSLNSLQKKYKIKNMTVVADSAMMSEDNFIFLKTEKLNYIVAARTANLSPMLITEISQQLNKIDNKSIRVRTENKGDLILHFSKKRYDKEKREMDKQLEKANYYLKHPSAAEIIKRTKFLKGKKLGYELNRDLINKTTLLLGIKGYYTNLDEYKLSNDKIIEQYKNLWKVEQNFRVSKSDLKARPIFHNKTQAIETHILICFMALALSRYIEIKTKKSIRSIVKELKTATDAIIYDQISNKKITIKADISNELQKILDELCSTR